MAVRYINPKHLHSLSIALGRLSEGTFDESDVRLLLLGMRDNLQRIAVGVKSLSDVPASVKLGAPLLADLAHSVAHPDLKDQGPIRGYVRSADAQMAQALKKMKSQRVISLDEGSKTVNLILPSFIKPFTIRDIVTLFIVQLRDLVPYEVPLEPLIAASAEIELCLLSIAHFVQLPDLDNNSTGQEPNLLRHGYLALHTWQGVLHLYAGVVNSKFEQVLSAGAKATRAEPYISVFPVFNSHVLSSSELEFDARKPKVVYAVRSSSGDLELREPPNDHYQLPWS